MSVTLENGGWAAGAGTTITAGVTAGIVLGKLLGIIRTGDDGGVLGLGHHGAHGGHGRGGDVELVRLQEEVKTLKEVSALKEQLAEQKLINAQQKNDFAFATQQGQIKQLQSFFTITPTVTTTAVPLAA